MPILTTGPFVRVKVVLKEILKDWFVASNTINVHKVFVAFLVSGLSWDFSKCNIYAVAQDFERIFLIYINEKVGASSLLPSSFHTENDSYCRDTLASSCPPPNPSPSPGPDQQLCDLTVAGIQRQTFWLCHTAGLKSMECFHKTRPFGFFEMTLVWSITVIGMTKEMLCHMTLLLWITVIKDILHQIKRHSAISSVGKWSQTQASVIWTFWL